VIEKGMVTGMSDIQVWGGWGSVLTALTFSGCMGYVLWRTQSFHVLRMLMWRLIWGKDPVLDPITQEFIDQQTSLMAFRLFSGLRVSSTDEIGQLKAWANVRGLNLQQLSYIANFFDVENRQTKCSRGYKIWHRFLVLFFGLTLVVSFALLTEQRVFISIKSTGHIFWIAAQKADTSVWDFPPLYKPPSFYKEHCESPQTKRYNGFELGDQEVLCQLWQQTGSEDQLRSFRKSQQFLAAYFLLISICGYGLHIFRINQIKVLDQLKPKMTGEEEQGKGV